MGDDASLAVAALDELDEGVIVLDRDWRYRTVNRAAAVLIGRPAADLLGRNMLEEFESGPGDPFYDVYRRVMETRAPEALEAYWEPWERWFENRVFPVGDDAIGVRFHETTARRVLELSAHRAETILSALNEGFFSLDQGWRYTYVNPAAAALHRCAVEELVGRTIWDVFDEESLGRFAQAFRRVMRTRVAERVEEYYAGFDGWFETRIVPLADGGIGIFATETTVARHVEQALLAAEARGDETASILEAVLHAAPFGIGFIDADARYVYANAMLSELTAGTPASLSGAALADLASVDGAALESVVLAVLETGERSDVADDIQLGGDRRNVVRTFFAVRHAKTGSAIGVGQIAVDVTEAERARADLARTVERLSLLHEIDAAVVAGLELRSIAPRILERLRQMIAAERVALLLPVEDTLVVAAVAGTRADSVLPVGSVLPLDPDERVALAAGRSVALDVRSVPALAGLSDVGVRTAMRVPLVADGTLAGVLVLGSSVEGWTASAETAEIARDVTARLVAGITNERLGRERDRLLHRLRTLHAIDIGILSADGVEDTASGALARLRELVGCRRASVALFDVERGEAELVAVSGEAETAAPAGTRVAIASLGDPALLTTSETTTVDLLGVGDLTPHQQLLAAEGITQVVNVPLQAQGQLIGSLNLKSDMRGFATDETLSIAREVADQLAVAIEHARSRERLAAALARVRALRELDLSILASDSPQDIASGAAHHLRAVTGVMGVVVWESTSESEVRFLAVDAEHPMPGSIAAGDARAPGWLTGVVASTGESIVLDDLEQASPGHAGSADTLAELRGAGVRSLTVLPLVVSGTVIGGLAVSWNVPGPHPAELRHTLEEVAGVLAVALQHAALTEEVRTFAATLEERVAERTDALEAANRDLDAFAYSVSHDLRAPLRAMEGFSKALLEDYAAVLDEDGRLYLQRIVAGAGRMETLINDLLEYSRLSRAELTASRVDLDVAIDHVLHGMREGEALGAAEVVVEHPLGIVSAHRATVELALGNLVENAAKYVAPGEQAHVRVRAERVGDTRRVWVEDDGIGIAPEHLERIFRVFERLHGAEAYAGTGVGLASVRKGVERMGGTVGVESTPGVGSAFWFELPAGGGG